MKKKRIANCCSASRFYINVEERLEGAKPEEYALVSVDLDNFKYINDLFGYEIGDQTLHQITWHFSGYLVGEELFSRINADNFVFFMRTTDSPIGERLQEMVNVDGRLGSFMLAHYNFVMSGGIFLIKDPAEKVAAMVDKANFARKQAKGNHISTFLLYTKAMSDGLQWKKEITLSMEAALEGNEFAMYLQPKILLKTGQIMGAEALVRWESKKNGLIYPDQFIPVFEQNGFIKLLDFYMLEQACLFLQKCMREDLSVLPISVNFSKVHIGTLDFVEQVFQMVNRHQIPTKLIEIELTESVFSRDFQALVDIASGLKYLGFKVSLDDFGSAYSSLGDLKDFSVDIIKIDKSFLNASTNSDKGGLIITKIVEMIQSLRLITVMEGVENQEQVDFLQKLNCDVGQGYFYAKPMPVADYEAFIKTNPTWSLVGHMADESPEKGHGDLPQEFQMDNWELYTLGQNIDMGLMKGYLDEEGTVQYVNRKALDYLGYTPQEFRQICHNKIEAFIHPDDAHLFRAKTEQMMDTGQPLNFQTRAIRKDGKVICLEGRMSCVVGNQGQMVGLYAFSDVTEDLERISRLQRALEVKIAELDTLYSTIPGGVIHCNADQGFSLLYYTAGFLEIIGYNEREFQEILPVQLLDFIVAEDRSFIQAFTKEQLRKHEQKEVAFRIRNKTGQIRWILEQGKLIKMENGVAQICCVLIDITREKEKFWSQPDFRAADESGNP